MARGFPGSGRCLTCLVGLSTAKPEPSKSYGQPQSALFVSSPAWVEFPQGLRRRDINAVTLRSATHARLLGHCGEYCLCSVVTSRPTDDDCQQTCSSSPQSRQNSMTTSKDDANLPFYRTDIDADSSDADTPLQPWRDCQIVSDQAPRYRTTTGSSRHKHGPFPGAPMAATGRRSDYDQRRDVR